MLPRNGKSSRVNEVSPMRRTALLICGLIALTIAGTSVAAEEEKPKAKPSKYPEWNKVIEGADEKKGLFNLYYNEKEQKLFMELSGSHFKKDYLLPISIARGAGFRFLGGDTLNFGDQWVVAFRRAGDRVLVVRRNIHFRAKDGSPQADAIETSYNDSVIAALSVKSERGSSVLVDLAELYMADLAGVGIRPDKRRSTWGSVKTFSGNVEVQVNAVFSVPFGVSDDVPDPRGTQVVVHYGLSELPGAGGYKPRVADDRVGHFLSVLKDYSSDEADSPFVRYVTRWHLVKADPSADMSPPKVPIMFWIEKTVPREYRRYVQEGILAWNLAFEKIGFIDAIQVRDQQSRDDFDPEDVNFNTFRWITTSRPFAMGPSRTNPKTGQILDADIVFDESMVRYWRREYLRLQGIPEGLKLLVDGHRQAWFKLHADDLPLLAVAEADLNRVLADPEGLDHLAPGHTHTVPPASGRWPRFSGRHSCLYGHGMSGQLNLMTAILMARGSTLPGGRIPEEYIGQAIREVTMHEVGHTLGLRHNFKASGMLSLEDCNNPKITAEKGMAGSVMDYLPANIAAEGEDQGDYFSPTIGPYDYWAIEYAYRPVSGNEKEELAKIASRVAEHELQFGTDEDMFGSADPRVNTYDLGDPLEYAKNRIALVETHLKGLADKVVEEGDGWQRAREAFSTLLGEYARAAMLASQYIGAEYNYRDHRDDPDAHAPFEPIELEKQREAISLLQKHVLADDAFEFSPELLRRLAPEYWSHWGMSGSFNRTEYPIYGQVLAIQRAVLSRFLDPQTLSRVQNVALHADEGTEVLSLGEVFGALTDSVWHELPDDAGEGELEISTIRRNLQREHAKRLSNMVLANNSSADLFALLFGGGFSSTPADARSLARLHLGRIHDRIEANEGRESTDEVAAHLSELHDQIEKVLEASLQSGGF